MQKSMTATNKDWPSIDVLGEKLTKARCRLMTREPWYGHICMNMVWRPSDFGWKDQEESKTMGVRILHGGTIECLWYPGFVHSQTLKQLYATIYHEIDHIVRLHCIRIGSHRQHEAWNCAADMTINGKRSRPRIGYVEPNTQKRTLPLDGQLVWVPEGWEDGNTTEVYYSRIVQNGPRVPCPKCQAAGKKGGDDAADGTGAGTPGNPDPGNCPTCGGQCGSGAESRWNYGGVSGRQLDDHSVWQQSEVSQDEARQLIRDIVQQASAKNQGNTPGHLAEAIRELNKPIVHWRELLRRYLGTHVGNKRSTYSRRNRRHDTFGIKGISRHAASRVRVIVDTSGSMSSLELQQAFTEIEMMSSFAEIKVLLWDAAYQGYGKYKRGDWKKWKLAGRGGTDMAAPVKWLEDNRQLGDCQILITDGYCNWSLPRPWYPELGMITVITHPEPPPPTWGHVVRLRVTG